MKRLLIVLVALGLLVASTAPARAKKPDPKPDPPLVAVTLVGDLDTAGYLDTDACGGPILMEESRRGVLTAGEVLSDREDPPDPPRIWIEAPFDVAGEPPTGWGRHFPTPILPGEDFSGCHGGPVDDAPPYWEGLLRITPTAAGVEILWIFDHYLDEQFLKPKAKKKDLIIENFHLRGEAHLVDGWYTGDFNISYFLRDDSNGGYTEYDDPGTVTLSFQLSTAP